MQPILKVIRIYVVFEGVDISLNLALETQKGPVTLRCVRHIHWVWKQVVLGQTLQLFSRIHSRGVRMWPYAVEKRVEDRRLFFFFWPKLW